MHKQRIDPGSTSKIDRVKYWIKSKRYSKKTLMRFCIKRLYDLATCLHTLKGILTDKQCRAVFAMKIFHPNRVHQPTPATAFDRFPVIFSACRDFFHEKNDLRILSFGCSTGEEVLTLRRYFPNAVLVGAEINKYSLEICRRRKLDDKMIFIESKQRCTRGYKRYKETSGLIGWKNHIFHSIFT